MAGASTDDEPLSGEQGVPSTLDLARHFRELRQVVLPALLVALLCAGVVFGVRSVAPPRWDATVVARAELATASQTPTADSTSVALLTAPYVALGVDASVLHDIVDAARVPWTDAEAASRITVSEGQTPGLLTIAVTGNSAEQASVVAKQAVATLDSAARSRAREAVAAASVQIQDDASALNDQVQSLSVLDPKRAALQAQYQSALDQIGQVSGAGLSRLAGLSDPVTSVGPVSPKPARDAALALLVVLIVGAELMVALRGRLGRTVSSSWAGRVARKRGATLVDCTGHAAEAGIVQMETLLLRRLRSGADVLILPAAPTVDEFLTLLHTVAGDEGHRGPQSGQLIVLSVDDPWWRSAAVEQVALAIVVGRRGAPARGAVWRQLVALAEAEILTVLLLVDKPWVVEADADPVEPEARDAGEAESAGEDREQSTTGNTGWQIVQ